MAIRGISLIALPAAFLSPDSADNQVLPLALPLVQSFESGGVAISDATQGRLVQTWRAWVDDGGTSIKLSPLAGTLALPLPGAPITTLVTGALNITSVSVAFDASMAPTLAYIENGTVKLRWFNTVTGLFQTDSFAGATSARVTTDDKRQSQEGASDVIFGYTRGATLYYRQQRDRYLIEYPVGAIPSTLLLLRRLGMSEANRVQFELAL